MNTTKTKTVLVVDDEEAILRFVQIRLRVAGYKAVTATNGKEALELIRSANPDIVVLDVVMPGMSGYDTLREIRTFSKVPVIVVTAAMVNGERAMNLGATSFMAKPFRPDDLIKKIETVLKAQDKT